MLFVVEIHIGDWYAVFNADQHNQIHHWSREYPFTTEKFYNMTFLYATDSPDTI